MNKKKYKVSVFVNCPFDAKYRPLFEAIIFAIHNAGYIVRCALEVADAAKNRLEKIMNIIEECKYGIHDISRTEVDPTYQLPRFNMSLELGIFLGCVRYGSNIHSTKSCIVFDREKHRYQKFISDIAGQDIESHNNKPDVLISKLRNWLRVQTRDARIPGGQYIYGNFREFNNDLPDMCDEMHIRVDELTYADYVTLIVQWLTQYEYLLKSLASTRRMKPRKQRTR